jgi:hypothetical protein
MVLHTTKAIEKMIRRILGMDGILLWRFMVKPAMSVCVLFSVVDGGKKSSKKPPKFT